MIDFQLDASKRCERSPVAQYEQFACDRGFSVITLEVMYAAKESVGA